MKSKLESFDDHANDAINEALSQADPPDKLTIEHWWKNNKKVTKYDLDFVEMIQISQDNGTLRRIKGYWNDDWNQEFDFQKLKALKDDDDGGTGSGIQRSDVENATDAAAALENATDAAADALDAKPCASAVSDEPRVEAVRASRSNDAVAAEDVERDGSAVAKPYAPDAMEFTALD